MNSKYLCKKIVQSLITLLIVLTVSFILFRAMPGDPVSMFIKQGLPPEIVELMKKNLGLDDPWYVQYTIYIKDMLRGDFGDSFSFKKPVMQVIWNRLPNTLLLAACAQTIAIFLGMLFGTIAAAFRGKKIDVTMLGTALFIYAMPAFWLGIVMISFFGVTLGWVPLFGMFTPGREYATMWAQFGDLAHHLMLPSFTFGLAITGSYTMIMRSSLLDVLTEDYIHTARAKGFNRRYIIRRHALPNAMLPMVTIIAINMGFIVAGAIQTETIFSWPGVGTLIFKALGARDYPLLQGSFLITSFCVVAANFLADIVYMYIDPRIRYQ